LRERFAVRGAGTNLKVGGGAHVRREALETFFSAVPLHFFGSIPPSTISRFGERFRGGHAVYSSVSFCFFLLAVLLLMVRNPVQAICKSGRRALLVLYGVGAIVCRS